MRRFKAKSLAAADDPDINTYVVILAEQSDGSGRRLEIQKSLTSNEQDRQLGIDTYCLCTEEGSTYYGDIVSWTLAHDSLEVVLDAKAADALGVEGGFVVDFAPENRPALKDGLDRVLG